MADYIINFTDPGNGSFVIKPMTTDGPASPSASTPLDPQATAAHTSVVLLGKGMFEYGERVAETLVHMLEHFSFVTAPAYPIQGQMWFKNTAPQSLNVYDGVGWQPVLIGSFPITGDLDMSGFRILNLGNPILGTDAVPLAFGDARWVNVTGDTMTGVLTVGNDIILTGVGSQITLPNAPAIGTDGVNKTYTDAKTLGTAPNKLSDVVITAPVLNQLLTYNGINWVNSTFFIPSTLDDLTDVTITAPAIGDLLTFNGGVWVNLPPSAFTDRYVTSGTMGITSPSTLTLAFSTAVPTPTIDIIGISPLDHTHVTGEIIRDTYQPNTAAFLAPTEPPSIYDNSYVRPFLITTALFGYPNAQYPGATTLEDVVRLLDQAAYIKFRPIVRTITQGDGTTTLTDLGVDYTTFTNTLSVYLNGVKQYASQRANAIVEFSSNVNSGSDTGLVDGAYTFDIRVDGTLYPGITVTVAESRSILGAIPGVHGTWQINDPLGNFVKTLGNGTYFKVTGSSVLAADKVYTVRSASWDSVTTTSIIVENSYTGTGPNPDGIGIPAGVYAAAGTLRKAYYYQQLFEDIEFALTGAGVPATITFRESSGFTIASDNVGSTSSVFIPTAGDTLFPALTAIASTSYAASQVPILTAVAPSTFTVTGDYTAAFGTGVQFVVYGSAANDNEYVTAAPATFLAGVTTITVTAATVANSGASGTIAFARDLSYEERDGSDANPYTTKSHITFLTPPASGDLIEAIATS